MLMFLQILHGGQQIPNDSIVGILRNIVAGWYISFRNLALIALVIIVMYLGIRIALSTIPEKTGQYKTALWSWIVSIILLFIIHYFMIAVFSINETILNLLENTNAGDTSIYETIETRAFDIRMNIGIPATIMYLILIIYFYKFLWIYMKRYFTVMILIIIAPFICAKYAFDGAKGKKGTSLTSWMYDFSMNVFLQSVHALLYTALMGVAINIAVSSLWGFIIALVFINFILKADKIFLDIFNFGKGANVKDVDKEFTKGEVSEAIAQVYFTKNALKFGFNTTKKLAHSARIAGRTAYGAGLSAIYEEDAELQRKKIKETKNSIFNKKDEIANKVYKKLHKGKDSEKAQLRIMARNDGLLGRRARAIIGARKDLKKKKFKSGLNIAKTLPLSVLTMLGGIPMFVIDPKSGYAMMSKGFKKYKKLSKPKTDVPGHKVRYHGWARIAQIGTLGGYGIVQNILEDNKKQNKKEGELSRTIGYIRQVDTYYDTAQEKWKSITKDMSEEEKNDLISKIKLMTIDGSTEVVSSSIYNYLNVNEMNEVTRENISNIVENALSETGLNHGLTEEQIDQVKQKVINGHNYSENQFINQVENVAKEVHQAVKEISFTDNDTKDLVSAIDSIEEINEKARKDVKQNIADTGRLIRDLRVNYEG